MLTFGVVSSLVATVLVAVGWPLVSTFLVNQRVRGAVRVAQGHAATVDIGLDQSDPSVPQVLNTLPVVPDARPLLRYRGDWYGSVPANSDAAVPPDLLRLVEAGTTATQRVAAGNDLLLVVGVPLPRTGGSYFELLALDELSRTLQVLSVSLMVAVFTLVLVNTAVGWLASRVALRPLTELTAVASAVAGGDLNARMSADDAGLEDLSRSFNDTVDMLQRRVAADARFAGDVSHELRTPLTTMINAMELLQNRRAELPAAALEPLTLLAGELERFRRLVVDLIDISRHDSGAPAQFEQVDVGDLVRQAADAAAGRPVTTVEATAEPLVMVADKRRLERVFANLVENADLHGGGCREVVVRRVGAQVEVHGDDAGPGVPPARRARVFERFARGDGPGSDSSGVGLGLAIVQRHVRVHGGTITVDDRPGGGARFVVTLPLRRGESP